MKRLYDKTTLLPLFAFLMVVSFNSCDKTCEKQGTCPEYKVVERTDIQIKNESASIVDADFRESIEEDQSTDLITYKFNTATPNQLQFDVHFLSGNTLSIRVIHQNIDNIWEGVNIDYAMYPTDELDDKWKYAIADFSLIGADSPSYSTNLGSNIPSGPILDVFRITAYNPETQEIQCRIRDLTLFKNTAPSDELYVNGTFVGAVTFL